jgi:hypothetical protein
MAHAELFAGTDEPAPLVQMGVACGSCGGTEGRTFWQTFADGTRHVRLECARCKRFIRWLPQHKHEKPEQEEDEPVGYYTKRPADVHAGEVKVPGSGWCWIGYVRLADEVWRPVALATSLARAWESLLSWPGRPEVLILPSRDTRKADGPPLPEPSAN